MYGYKKGDQVIIKPQFLSANAFKNDSAQVTVKDSSYVINAKGEWLTTLTDSIKYRKDKFEEANKKALVLDKKAWQAAKRKNSIASYQSYLKDYENGKYIKSAQKAIYELRNPPKPDEIVVVKDDNPVEETTNESTLKKDKSNNKEEDIDVPFSVIDVVPVFPGCTGNNRQLNSCFNQKINEHISLNINGNLPSKLGLTSGLKRILVTFKIDKNGNISNISARGPHTKLEEEAIRVIKLLPKMRPGTQRGKTVNVPYSLPIYFNVID